ncbi:hypothetical protein IWZ00DRAFT_182456 [Phyllosticta capitalensis]
MSLAMGGSMRFVPKVGEFRSVVDLDWKLKIPLELETNWRDFVLLSVGLGINLVDFDPTQKEMTLRDRLEFPALSFYTSSNGDWIFRAEPRDYMFSMWYALASVNVMCLERAGSRYCRSLARFPEGRLASDVLSSTGHQLEPPLNSFACKFETYAENAESIEKPLSAAITWMFYQREFGDILPVSQQLLQTREQILCYFKTHDCGNHLEARISAILEDPAFKLSKFIKEEVLDGLRRALKQSTFVKGSWSLRNVLETVRKHVKEHQKHKNLNCSRTCAAIEAARDEFEKIDDGPLQHSPGLLSSTRFNDRLLITHRKAKKVKQRFDPYINIEFGEERNFGDDSDDLLQMAQLLLALSPWDGVRRLEWEIRGDISYNLRQIREKLVSPVEHTEDLTKLLDETMVMATNGAFTAPRRRSIYDVLRMKALCEKVYLA